jgi:hypothetical protein
VGAADEWAGHPDGDILRAYPWLANLTDDELARGVEDGAAVDELRAAGEALRAAAGLEVGQLPPVPASS